MNDTKIIENLPAEWDMEADVVAVGSGGGGLAAAITAVDHGASAMVLERTDQVGGVTAYSLGEVWVPGNHLEKALGIEDSIESGLRYVKRLGLGYANDVTILNQAVHGPAVMAYFERAISLKMTVIRDCPDYYYGYSNDSLAEGRLLEVEPFAAEALGEWQARTRVSPHVMYGLTHEDIFRNGGSANIRNWDFSVLAERLRKDERCLGSGLVCYFVKGALDRGIPMHTGVEVTGLIGDGQRVVGVRARKDGQEIFVRANRGVVVAVSSYERSPVFTKTLGQQLDVQSVIMPEVDGAHLRLAGKFGARVARVPDVTMLGFKIPGEELQDGVPLWRNAMAFAGLPHSIVVNSTGARFANEAFYRSLYFAVDDIDGATQTHPNFPCWLVLDSQAREKYPLASIMPGDALPEEVGVTADSLSELAARTGIDAQGLEETVRRFNGYCEAVEDPEFGRGSMIWGAYMSGDRFHEPNPNLGPLLKAPFYAVPLHRLASSGIASAGIVVDEHCRAVGWDGDVIDGLYLAGNSVARLDSGAVMQSGMSNARGITHGYLAGRHAAGAPSDLLEKAIAAGALD
ncbi:FAD-binding protein [Novosphingobium mangrovi (ex Huang et al. 2023)]|uniref:FAD-binding protein n=1 Tax=Novosphingobium mangrovi (ex Huang et al. 2023) TaxID=2976432 RepID=A0ABT2I602_9SPHN|nr:FAD-binding protein [Novosphingobium mangrovi (ex Huang et al. 2023)]MCT2400236.1 FAD-binding protein [Novosphingobium mangrovi (ex Huang et al. 2023)]